MAYEDSQSRRFSCAVVAACGLGFPALIIFNIPFGDPAVHIAWEKDFTHPVDSDCIGETLRTIAEDVRRTTYVSSGSSPRGFDGGIRVIQFNYPEPTRLGYYSLDVAELPNGVTHYWHQWGKIGTDISETEKAQVVPLLNRANEAIARRCGLSFLGSSPQQGDG